MLALGAGCRDDEVTAVRVVVGRVDGPDADRLAHSFPVSVSFATAERGFLSTEGGRLLATADGGRSWRPVRSRRLLTSLNALAGNALVAVETRCAGRRCRAFLVRADGARQVSGSEPQSLRWTTRRELGSFLRREFPHAAPRVDFVDRLHGVLIGKHGPRRTADGGRTWTRLRNPCPEFFAGVDMLDARHGLLLCGSVGATIEMAKTLYATSDGGRSWNVRACTVGWADWRCDRRAPKSVPSQGHAGGLAFHDLRRGFIIAGRIGLYRTDDGGRVWHTSFVYVDGPSVDALSVPSPQRAYALLSNGTLIRTEDGGGRWHRLLPARLGSPPGPVSFSTARDGIGAGRNDVTYDPALIVQTHDGGRSWQPRGRVPHAVVELRRVDRELVWATTLAAGGPRPVLLYRSTDDGRSWRRVPGPPAAFYSVSPLSSSAAFAMSNAGVLFRTGDTGRHWRLVSRSGRDLRIFRFVSRNDAIALDVLYARGGAGLFRSLDGGTSWRFVYPSGS